MMSNSGSSWGSSKGSDTQPLETICKMLAMLSCSEKMDAHKNLLAMTNSPESCQSLRRAGCVPLLIQILHPGSSTPPDSQPSNETKLRAAKALKNIVHFNPDEKLKRREWKVLKLLEQIRSYASSTSQNEHEEHPTSALQTLMRLSFDENDKSTICTLGGIQALADFVMCDHKIHGPHPEDGDCVLTRRYACMTLTNLTFGDEVNKALLCSMTEFLNSLVSQLYVENEDIVQVTASVLRNLSWHADSNSRKALSESHAVTGLMKAALKSTKDSTLKATLSALWNLSAHSAANKAEICSTPNSLKFLLTLLNRNKTLTKENVPVVENAGGIIRNVSAHCSGVEQYRVILQENRCFEIMLEQMKSLTPESLTIVTNACGTLWNLSSHPEEQRKLLELNAVPMLKHLMYSKHPRISQGASAALRNILTYYEQSNELRQNAEPDSELPLDLTINSSKSSPIRKYNPPAFLNPPISYNGSVSTTRSCPEIQLNKQQQQQQQQGKVVEDPSDETFNYSNYDEEEEEEKHQQKDTVKTYCDEGTPGFSGSMVDLSSQAVDSFLQFQVEDTPAVFSRTSSLSSIEENQHGETRAEKMMDPKKSSAHINIAVPSSATANTSSSSLPSAPVKRVMFSAEETPLMFSRCSSVASLESCGDLNNGRCGSDCVSEFSRRTSGVVSPSELPDSPRAEPQQAVRTPPEPPQEEDSREDFNEDEGKSKPAAVASTTDELKVFAMEGTPFLISTATSLSDIVGELDTSMPAEVEPSQSEPPPPRPMSQPCSTVVKESEGGKELDVDLDDPIYSDVQLLQKCIKAGRAVGFSKKPTLEDEEVDLSHLIQRGRAKVLNRSEDNLKQCGLPYSMRPPIGSHHPGKHSSGTLPLPNKLGNNIGITFLNQNMNGANANINGISSSSPQVAHNSKLTQSVSDYTISTTTHNDLNRPDNQNQGLNLATKDRTSPNQNTVFYQQELDNKESLRSNSLNINATDDTDNTPSQSDDATTWTDETPSFSTSLPSMSINRAMKKVIAMEDEALSEVEPPTLDSLGTLESGGGACMNLVDSHHKLLAQRHQQLLLLQTSSSQVSNLMNQKPPQEFFDLDNSMISVASIKSEIFDESLQPISSPQLSSHFPHSQHNQNNPIPPASTTTTPAPDNTTKELPFSTFSPNTNTITKPKASTSSSPRPSTPGSVDSGKYDTFVIKRVESPKERRKTDPDRYLTRTIEKFDLKIKPPVPPKPAPPTTPTDRQGLGSGGGGIALLGSSTAVVRSTRASELRASRSRDHSPTHSTTSLHTAGTSPIKDSSGGSSASSSIINGNTGSNISTGAKIPPKPPVRSTPPLNNTTLPRNAKLMEGNTGSIISANGCSNGMSSTGSTSGMVYTLESLQTHHLHLHHPHLPLPPMPSKESGQKLNLGGRIGNLFRKSFTKNPTKKGENSTTSGGIWVKRKEKALVPPFNYKPPPDLTNLTEVTHHDQFNLNGNNFVTHHHHTPNGITIANPSCQSTTPPPQPSPSPPALPARNTTPVVNSTSNGNPPSQGGNNNPTDNGPNEKKSSKITTV